MAEYTPAQIDERIKADPEMQALAQNDETEFLERHAAFYREFGYKPDGSPLPRAQKIIKGVSSATGIPQGVVKGVASAVIPTATTIGGAMAGAASPIPGGTVMGAAGGAVAGEYANYGLGITEEPPTAIDLGVAAGSSLVGPAISRAKGGISSMVQGLPGAGRYMHQIAADTVKKKLNYMEATDEMVDFMREGFKSVPTFKTDVPLLRSHLKQELNDVTKSLMPDDPYIKKLNALTRNLSSRKTVSFEDLMATEKSFIAAGAEDPRGIWKKLSGVLIEDLETQAKNPNLTVATREKILHGAEAYKNFVAVNQRKQGQKALDSILNKSVTEIDDGLVRFNKQAFLKSLKSDGMNAFEPTEIDAMREAVKDLGYLGGAANSRTSNVTHTGSLGAAGLAGYAIGGVPGVIGATVAIGTLRAAMATPVGRGIVTFLAKKGHGKIDPLELKGMLGKAVAGASAGTVAGVTGAGAPEGTKPFVDEQ